MPSVDSCTRVIASLFTVPALWAAVPKDAVASDAIREFVPGPLQAGSGPAALGLAICACLLALAASRCRLGLPDSGE